MTTDTTFVPPLAAQLIDRFEMRLTTIAPPPANGRPTHTDRATRLWTATAWGFGDGYALAETMTTEFSWPPNPNYGDWPTVMEFFRVHDPKDNPPEEPDRLFQFIRLTYIERGLYVALYPTKADAVADAWRSPDEED